MLEKPTAGSGLPTLFLFSSRTFLKYYLRRTLALELKLSSTGTIVPALHDEQQFHRFCYCAYCAAYSWTLYLVAFAYATISIDYTYEYCAASLSAISIDYDDIVTLISNSVGYQLLLLQQAPIWGCLFAIEHWSSQ